MAGLLWDFFTVGRLRGFFTFAGIAFFTGVTDFFAEGFGTGVIFLGGGGGTHSLKVISSIAKSFPQPPGLWFTIKISSEPSDAGVVNIKLYCVQRTDCTRATSPIPSCEITFPDNVWSRMVTSGNSGKGHLSVILHTFIIHVQNSYWVAGFKPLTVVLKKAPAEGDELINSIFPFTSPGVWSSVNVCQSSLKHLLVYGVNVE